MKRGHGTGHTQEKKGGAGLLRTIAAEAVKANKKGLRRDTLEK